MANSGFEALGDVLAGGTAPAVQQAFMQGQLAKANVQHLSADTQRALEAAQLTQMQATRAQDENTARQNYADALIKLHPELTPAQAYGAATLLRGGAANFPQLTQGQGEWQTQNFRKILADPNADPNVRLGASMGIEGHPVSPYVTVPQENINAFGPGAATPTPGGPDVNTTPIGDAIAAQHNAAAQLATEQAQHPDLFHPSPGDHLPAGYKWIDPMDPSKGMTFIPGGPADPDGPHQMGARESVYLNRVTNAAELGSTALHNLANLNANADTGILGTGIHANPGTGLLSTPIAALKNAMSSQSTQRYNTIATGLEQNLATIESAGMVPSGTFTNNFTRILAAPGDKEITRLTKMAEARQIIEKGLQHAITSGRTPQASKTLLQDLVRQVQTAIPFTQDDVTALERAQDPNMTMQDVIKQRFPGNTAPASSATPNVTPPLTNAQGWTLHKDAQGNMAYVSPDGKQYQPVQ